MDALSDKYAALAGNIETRLGDRVERLPTIVGELGFVVAPEHLLEVCEALRDVGTDGIVAAADADP